MNVLKWSGIAVGTLFVVAAFVLLLGLLWLSRNQPAADKVVLGVVRQRFQPCPETPNCVSTQADPADRVHYVEPVEIVHAEEALEKVERWIQSSPRAEMVTRRDDYIHAVFTSRVFGFKDDLEIFVPGSGDVMHVRSASRVGQGDMGVNRARYEEAKAVLAQDG